MSYLIPPTPKYIPSAPPSPPPTPPRCFTLYGNRGTRRGRRIESACEIGMQHESIKLKRPKRRSTRKPGKGRANAAMLLLFFFFHPLFARRCNTQNKQETAHIRQCYVLRRPRYTQRKKPCKIHNIHHKLLRIQTKHTEKTPQWKTWRKHTRRIISFTTHFTAKSRR